MKSSKKYGRYASKAAYENAKRDRRINARKWRKNHKAQSRYSWHKSNTKDFIKNYANKDDVKDLDLRLSKRQKGLKF